MKHIEHFVPGDHDEDACLRQVGVLSRLRQPIPAGVTRAYVEAYSDLGDVVLVPYCQGPAVVREILAAKRRALALNFDPALVLIVEEALTPLPARQLDAAVARLGDSLKQGIPLRHYLEGLYATTCPSCLRPAVADYFVWDREQDAPVDKNLHCPLCAWDGRTTVDAEDLDRLARVPVQEMHYHYVLDRVAAQQQGGALRARLEPLLKLYTPRNLYALGELTLKIESLFSDRPQRRALNLLLLDCLDRCSSLRPLPDSTARRRGLSRPGRFFERNVWRAFEESANRLQGSAGAPLSGLTDTLEAFRASSGTEAGFVGQRLVRDLPRIFPPRSVGLILVSPPPLNAATWTLSYLWGGWVLGADAAAPLRPLLRQRTPDPTWYARVMASSFRKLASLLRDDGHLVLILTGQRPSVMEALLLAASRARLGVASLVQCGADYRLDLTPSFPPKAPVRSTEGTTKEFRRNSTSPAPLEAQIQAAATEAGVETIRMRGEPVPWPSLHAAIQRRLAELSLVARALDAEGEGPSPLDLMAEHVQAGLDDPAFVRLPGGEGGQELWWLANPAGVARPLGDRVEIAAYQVLQNTLALTEVDFAGALFAQFPGALTPEATLVATCLRSYGREVTPGFWQLRTEDLPHARQTEQQGIVEHLQVLGRRLGYRTAPLPPFDAAWFEADQVRAAFVVRWQAAVSAALAILDRPKGARPYLVIPGGRSALVSYKLARNPVWQQTLGEAGWGFIKYRHVRHLVTQPDVDQYALQTIVGLDPIVEQDSAQLSMF